MKGYWSEVAGDRDPAREAQDPQGFLLLPLTILPRQALLVQPACPHTPGISPDIPAPFQPGSPQQLHPQYGQELGHRASSLKNHCHTLANARKSPMVLCAWRTAAKCLMFMGGQEAGPRPGGPMWTWAYMGRKITVHRSECLSCGTRAPGGQGLRNDTPGGAMWPSKLS